MTTQEKECICLVALFAAFADGAKSEAERAQFRGLLDQLGLANAAQLVSRALLDRTALTGANAGLTSAARSGSRSFPTMRSFCQRLASAAAFQRFILVRILLAGVLVGLETHAGLVAHVGDVL